jgi:glyoxylase I family protein
MPITHLFAGVAVSDFAAARRWYEALFGRPPDMLPKEGEAVWHVTTFGSVYVTADPARAGSALVTIAVSNLDEHTTALAARGLSLDELGADSSALQQLTITDDDGNCIKFSADPPQPTA